MIPTAELSHGLPGRSRIRVRSKRGDPDYFLQVGQELEKLSAVYAVQVNDRTGSILITHEEEALEQIAAQTQSAGLFLLDSVHYEPKPVLQKAATGLVNLDSSWRGMTSGHFDFRSILYVVLIITAIVQMMRGQILVPATTLLWYAMDLLRSIVDKRSH